MSDAPKLIGLSIQSDVDLHAEQNRLRDRLMKIEQHLCSLPWKSETSVSLDSLVPADLRFQRLCQSWGLVVFHHEEGEESRLRDASPEIQSLAAQVLPFLMRTMQAQFEARAKAVKTGHAALDELEKQIQSPPRRLVVGEQSAPAARTGGKAGS